MSKWTRPANLIVAASFFACALLGTAAWAASGPKISKEVAAPFSAAVKAAQAGNWQEAITQARAAQAVASRTPFDDLEINILLGQAAINLKDMNTATTALEAAADSPANADLDPNDRVELYHNALLLASNAQHWQKVIAYSHVLEPANKMDDAMDASVAIAYYNLKDTANATAYAQKSIAASKAAGKQPDENALKMVMNSQAQSNPAAAEQTLESLVMQSNSPADWGQLISVAFTAKGMNDPIAMDLYRLSYVTHALKSNEAGLAGKLANQLRYYGDAVSILQSAGIGGADLNSAKANSAKEQGSLTAEIAAARKAGGQTALSVAEALYGYGRFADAEALARQAVSKGGTKSPGQAQMLLGMSLARQDKFAEARQAFSSVSGSPAMIKVAHLWGIYAQVKGASAPAANSPPPASH
jgi:tetratricopeptide (TPR) repeat protein